MTAPKAKSPQVSQAPAARIVESAFLQYPLGVLVSELPMPCTFPRLLLLRDYRSSKSRGTQSCIEFGLLLVSPVDRGNADRR